jgi:hypothetical protein
MSRIKITSIVEELIVSKGIDRKNACLDLNCKKSPHNADTPLIIRIDINPEFNRFNDFSIVFDSLIRVSH